jgi:predicted RNA-binding Zn-ribbon protein involved in translation (DUF1610 family)
MKIFTPLNIKKKPLTKFSSLMSKTRIRPDIISRNMSINSCPSCGEKTLSSDVQCDTCGEILKSGKVKREVKERKERLQW